MHHDAPFLFAPAGASVHGAEPPGPATALSAGSLRGGSAADRADGSLGSQLGLGGCCIRLAPAPAFGLFLAYRVKPCPQQDLDALGKRPSQRGLQLAGLSGQLSGGQLADLVIRLRWHR